MEYNTFLKLPQLKNVGNIGEFKSKKALIKELKGNTRDEIEISGSALQEKEMAFFGYRFFDIKNLINHSYEKDSKKNLRDFLESNEIVYIKLKHKSEPNYNQIIAYKNFYLTELDFSDNDDVEGKVKFNEDYSSYTKNYWQERSFPNLQNVFNSFFKDNLKENKIKNKNFLLIKVLLNLWQTEKK